MDPLEAIKFSNLDLENIFFYKIKEEYKRRFNWNNVTQPEIFIDDIIQICLEFYKKDFDSLYYLIKDSFKFLDLQLHQTFLYTKLNIDLLTELIKNISIFIKEKFTDYSKQYNNLKEEYENYKITNSRIIEEQKIQYSNTLKYLEQYEEEIKSIKFSNKKLEEDKNKIISISNDYVFNIGNLISQGNQYKKNSLFNEYLDKVSQISNYNYNPPRRIESMFQSQGLKNLGNTCYINCVLQTFTHLNISEQVFVPQSIINMKLFSLINSLQNNQNSSEIDEMHRDFITYLSKVSDDFPLGEEGDPKYLIIFLQKQLINDYLNLFRWTKTIKYTHDTYIYPYSVHEGVYPEQISIVFTLNTIYQSFILKSDISNFINDYVTEKEQTIQSYCEECRKTTYVKEKIQNFDSSPYITFAFSNSDHYTDIEEIKFINSYYFKLSLVTIIQRRAISQQSAHNYCICKEGEKWIQYNDNIVKEYNESRIENIYILVFKVDK